MAVKKRIRLKASRRWKLTSALRFCFMTDSDPMGELGVGLTDASIQAKLSELWKIHRDEALALFIVEHPGQRPDIWWRLESPELRPEIAWRDASDNYVADRALKRAEEIDILFRYRLLTAKERRLL
jgi:hypothetical protein